MNKTTISLLQNLPSGERYLYQLFSLIETRDLTVSNPQGETFQFGSIVEHSRF